MKPKQYRKKPVVIEAIKFDYTEECIEAIKEFCGESFGGSQKARCINAKAELLIKTLEDGSNGQVKHIATEGDYIIKGVQGEFYPCKPDIFALTYEEVDVYECEGLDQNCREYVKQYAENGFEKSGIIASKIAERCGLVEHEEAFFIAGFTEAVKFFQNINKELTALE